MGVWGGEMAYFYEDGRGGGENCITDPLSGIVHSFSLKKNLSYPCVRFVVAAVKFVAIF